MEQSTSFSLHFAPLLPTDYFIVAVALGLAFFLLAFFKSRRGSVLRAVTLALFLLFLANPSLVEEERQAVADTAVIVVDQSQSQTMEQRQERTQTALKALQEKLGIYKDLNVRIIEAPDVSNGMPNETLLFDALDKVLADVPMQRRAGVIFLTDGQVHDIPANKEDFIKYGPVHVLLSGEKDERDRRIVIKSAPLYSLVGHTARITYTIEQTGTSSTDDVPVTLKRFDGTEDHYMVTPGEEQSIELNIDHAGQNVFELTADPLEGEITQANNRAALLINGVRDRLKVLLVSGQPHAGGRMWRDMLTSDPGVDLIHFTILREPDKLDATPQEELSLIAFPFRELFEVKLYDFDLIIFDRYKLNRILPDNYFDNIVRYVEEGGALLEASGPSYAGDESIYFTALQKILPGTPNGDIIEQPFLPHLTADGALHPVTRGLSWKGETEDGKPAWGHWMRQVGLNASQGDVLMSGANELPLLILNRVGKGRVAQLASDQIWLWSRGFEGGGPYAELVRRTVHWLMKEPELDEKALDVTVEGNTIAVRNQNYHEANNTVAMTKPDGAQEMLALQPAAQGYEAKVKADQLGIYTFEDTQGESRFAVIGDLNPPELSAVTATPALFMPMVSASKGGVLWLADTAKPEIRLSRSAPFAGRNWIALRQNHDYIVTGLKDRPLLPAWAVAAILLGIAILAWWREGRA